MGISGFCENCVKLAASLLIFISTSCTNLFYQPTKSHFLDPKDHKLSYQDISFTTQDGIKLHGWFFKSRKKSVKGTVIQFHGNAQNLSTHFLSLVWMIEQGYNLFTFDYRGYGKSEGKPTPDGVYLDALAALDKGLELQQLHGKGHYVAFGQSLGGAVLLRALPDFKQAEKVTFLVQDSTFSSYQEIAADRLSSVWFLWPFQPLAYLLVTDKYASEKVFSKIHWKTLVIVGGKDTVMPSRFGKKIYHSIVSEKKWLWHIPESPHIAAFFVEGGKYRSEFTHLLEGNGPE